MAAIIVAVSLGIASQARADTPAPANSGAAAEHVPAGMGMGNSGVGYAVKNRPSNDTQTRAMKEVLCPCGCARQSVLDCECASAADLRGVVMGMLANADLSTEAGRTQAYDTVLAKFKQDYGAAVLATPPSNAAQEACMRFSQPRSDSHAPSRRRRCCATTMSYVARKQSSLEEKFS